MAKGHKGHIPDKNGHSSGVRHDGHKTGHGEMKMGIGRVSHAIEQEAEGAESFGGAPGTDHSGTENYHTKRGATGHGEVAHDSHFGLDIGKHLPRMHGGSDK